MALGGLLGGGGGGGGGGGVGSQVGLNSIIGSLAGGLAADREAKQKSQARQRLRKAARQAEGQSASEALGVTQSAEFTAAQNFLSQLFGVQGFATPGSELTGTFAGGENIGGDILFGTGGRLGLGRGNLKKGKKLGKQIAKGLEARNLLESGESFKNKRMKKLNKQFEKGQSALNRLRASPNFRTGAARTVQERGFNLQDVDTLSPLQQGQPGGTQPIGAEGRVGGFNPAASPAGFGVGGGFGVQPGGGQGGGFGVGGFDPLTQNINKQLRQSLGKSGFDTSLAGVAAESLGTGLARTQLQMEAIPQLLGLNQTNFNLRQQALPTNLNLATARSGLPIGLGPDPFQASIEGGLAGLG
jgi:hypothetical protein